MSFLNVTYKGKKRTYHLDDGKSDLLDRYVNLDEGYMYYTMGKQIAGKPINPNGATGRKVLRIARELSERDAKKTERDVLVGSGWGYQIYKTPNGKIVYKKHGKALDMRPYNRRWKWAFVLLILSIVFTNLKLFPLALLCIGITVVLFIRNIF